MTNPYPDELLRLQTRIRQLEEENQHLKDLLKKAGLSVHVEDSQNSPKPSLSAGSGAPVILPPLTDHMVKVFFSYFWGRTDIYARRVVSKNQKAGYYPQCRNFWQPECPKRKQSSFPCKDCSNKEWKSLNIYHIKAHLEGLREDSSDVIGIYPLFADNTTRLLVFDFDEHETVHLTDEQTVLEEEIFALRTICKEEQIPCLVERSRSGRGAHLWIFFDKPINAGLVRKFGNLLLDHGAEKVNIQSFLTYDRMLPAQDFLKQGMIGNLVALPWQGKALQQGNSCFVDEQMKPYADQWDALINTPKMTEERVRTLVDHWTNQPNVINPWEQSDQLSMADAEGKIKITLANAIYIDKSNILPRMLNSLRRMARFSNPVFFKNQAIGLSNYENTRWIYLGADEGKYLILPRGLKKELLNRFSEANIDFEIADQRAAGEERKIRFQGELRQEQKEAADQLLSEDSGILHATTAFGKTVVGTYLIAERKTNTLILLENSSLIEQWTNAVGRFLKIDEELPTYQTPTGRIKTRKTVVGRLQGSHDSRNGIIDIAMAGSLVSKTGSDPLFKKYGMIIVDECHHAASETIQKILKESSARYVYGVTATPVREDGLQKINYLLIGPILYEYTAKERARQTGIRHYVIPRFTRTVYPRDEREKRPIYDEYHILQESLSRDEQIIEDTLFCLKKGRTPVVLTKFNNHATRLYTEISKQTANAFLLLGSQGKKEREEIRKRMNSLSDNEPMVLIGTGQLIGEGFDFPRLDTLIMAMPIAGKSVAAQYAGRLDREYPAKEEVIIYDYIDHHIPVFAAMYHKRMRAYKELGYEISETIPSSTDSAGKMLFSTDDFESQLLQDIAKAKKQIIISSASLNYQKVQQLLAQIKPVQERGVRIYLSTWTTDAYRYGKADARAALLENIRLAGVQILYHDDWCPRYVARGKMILPSFGKEFFLSAVSTFFCPR